MKRISLLLFVLFVSTFSVRSQINGTPAQKEKWERFESISDEFSVETPIQLVVDGERDAASSRRYFGELNGRYFYVFSDPIGSKYYFTTINRFLHMWSKAEVTESSETVAKRVTFTDPHGYYQHILVLRTDARVYVAQVVTRNQNDLAAARFISTFGIDGRRQAPPATAAPKTNEKDTSPESGNIAPISKNSNSGIGHGTGSGSGQGSGVGIGVTPTCPDKDSLSCVALKNPHETAASVHRYGSILFD